MQTEENSYDPHIGIHVLLKVISSLVPWSGVHHYSILSLVTETDLSQICPRHQKSPMNTSVETEDPIRPYKLRRSHNSVINKNFHPMSSLWAMQVSSTDKVMNFYTVFWHERSLQSKLI